MEALAKAWFGFTVFFVGIILKGFVLTILWGWFVSDIFGLRRLSIAEALGVALLVGALTYQYAGEDNRTWVQRLIYMIVTPVLFLVLGWVYHQFQ